MEQQGSHDPRKKKMKIILLFTSFIDDFVFVRFSLCKRKSYSCALFIIIRNQSEHNILRSFLSLCILYCLLWICTLDKQFLQVTIFYRVRVLYINAYISLFVIARAIASSDAQDFDHWSCMRAFVGSVETDILSLSSAHKIFIYLHEKYVYFWQ